MAQSLREKIGTEPLRRMLPFGDLRVMADEKGQEESRMVEFSASSEYPVERWWGTETLVHSEDTVDLSRFNDGGVLLFNHSAGDYIGVIERAWIDKKRVRCQVRFDTHERADQIFQSVRNGILRGISIGYQIMEWEETHSRDSEMEHYRITRWQPYEASIVSIPADPTVGVGRSLPPPATPPPKQPESPQRSIPTPTLIETMADELDQQRTQPEATPTSAPAPVPSPAPSPVSSENRDLLQGERDRIAALNALGQKFAMDAGEVQRWINSGVSLVDARAIVLERIGSNPTPVAKPANPVGLNDKEQRQYSLRKAILAMTLPDFREDAGFEREISQQIGQQIGRPTGGIYVPVRDLAAFPNQQRDIYNVSVTASGGQMVDTVLDTGRLIDFLRNRMLISRMGAEVLSGLQGDLVIPTVTGVSNVYWVAAEGLPVGRSRSSFGSLRFMPRTLGVISSYTRQLLLQSSIDIEGYIRRDLTASMALEIDRAAINGQGGDTGQPLGLLTTPGISTIDIGTNGGPLTYGKVVDLMSTPATVNADIGTQYFLTNAKVRGLALQTEVATATGRFLFEMAGEDPAMGRLIGMPCGITNQVPGNLTKGTGTNLSPLIFGNYNDLMMAEWGVLELLPNPYGSGYESGAIEIRALQTMDIEIRQTASFAKIVDIVTTI